MSSSDKMTNASSKRHRVARALRLACGALIVVGAAPLAGCGGVNKALPPPVAPRDYHERHAVVLAETSHTAEIVMSSSGDRDSSVRGIIRDFIIRYRKLGHGPISLLAPVGGADGGVTRANIDEIRRLLGAAGVRGQIIVGTYPTSDPNLVAPIRLSFNGVKAKVKGRCGEWPDDLASGGGVDGWRNESFWNFGCASQSTLSAQIDDPRDLMTPRGQTDVDIEMRMRAIGNVRKGTDPTTQWTTKGTNISTVGGN